jgi:hypothetical protein
MSGKVAVLQEIWDLGKDNLTSEEIKNKLLLATNCEENTAWHLAAMGLDAQGTLQKIWDLAKDNLTSQEINNMLLLVTNGKGNNAWHLAA